MLADQSNVLIPSTISVGHSFLTLSLLQYYIRHRTLPVGLVPRRNYILNLMSRFRKARTVVCLESVSVLISDSLPPSVSVRSSLWVRRRFFGGCDGKMYLLRQRTGFKVQELKKQFFYEVVNMCVLFFENEKNMTYLFLVVENNSNKTQASKMKSGISSPLIPCPLILLRGGRHCLQFTAYTSVVWSKTLKIKNKLYIRFCNLFSRICHKHPSLQPLQICLILFLAAYCSTIRISIGDS